MNPSSETRPSLAPHRVQTVNLSINSSNRIHDDETAARYGFRGGLVPGTLVYAHLTTPLVEALGSAWLDGSVSELKLLQPAYDGEWLSVEGGAPASGGGAGAGARYEVRVRNEAGMELALLDTQLPAALPPVDARAERPPAAPDTPVAPIAWDVVQVDSPLRALAWSPTMDEQAQWCTAAGDALPLYREGSRPRIHPGLVLQGANRVFSNHFALNPWIHTSSRIVQRGALCVGDAVEIRAIPIEKWERKGHEFVTLYVAFRVDGRVAVEVWHSAIFTVRPRQA